MAKTTIQISKELADKLTEVKIHYRETYDDVIKRLIKQNKLNNSMAIGKP